ncbi:MAG: protein kinase [Gemmatimonadales bacterium]|nr:protein kinase [Gemmatimonadales bacterium]
MTELPDADRDALRQRYALERELGRGGMATVYLARDLRHDRPVALKVLHPELAATMGPERFQREIRFAARLQHPHILTVLDSGEASGQLWFTMPFVEGESLRDRLRRERQLAVDAALQIARETARALDYAHQHDIVHRDIKPENILLTRDGSTLVADFGIARAVGGDDHLTQTGMAIGTPAYMSPEQAAGDKGVDARTDVYSLGAVLYEMLAGEAPFTGPTAQAIIAKRLSEPPPSVRRVRPNVPEAVDQAIQRALATVAADRFASAAELNRALQGPATTSGTPVTTPEPMASAAATSPAPARPASRRRPVPVLAVTLIAGFLLGLGVLFAWRNSRDNGGTATAGSPRVLAVLPFENLGDSTTDYFADGVTDAVRGKLSSLPGLQVIASSSSNEYKAGSKPLPVIARELEADYLLIARIRWAKAGDGGSRVKVSPELVDVSRGGAPKVKWQQPFDAEITDVFTVQADIADQVASALDLALGTGQKQALAERPTQNLAAYDAFLKGEASEGLTVSNAPTLRSAINYYEQAVALDSTFAEAWAQLGRAQGAFYYNVTPTPEAGEASKNAADRSIALAPGRPHGWMALCEYYTTVIVDYGRALEACRKGLALTPENADLLTAAALSEQGLGQWDDALRSLEKARRLDPRSALTARRLSHTLLRLRRYPEALAAVDRGLAVSPGNLDLIENKAMIKLGQGDLEGARLAVSNAPPDVEPTALVTFFGNYWDLFWALDDSHQRLLLRLPPSAFDGDRGTWGLVRAQTHLVRGDTALARVYADSARLGFEETLADNPDDPQRRILLGLALAHRGKHAEAIKEGERGLALLPPGGDGYTGPYLRHQLARIYILVGETDRALDQLEALLRMPYYLSPGWLRIDPTFDPLRKNARFQKLVGAGTP